jgi:hypothetical protein
LTAAATRSAGVKPARPTATPPPPNAPSNTSKIGYNFIHTAIDNRARRAYSEILCRLSITAFSVDRLR